MTIPTPAISASGLRKSYGDKLVLDGIDIEVAGGEIFSLLGPNGAGKTTTVQILSTLIRADAGRAAVDGHDLSDDADAVRRTIGVTGQFAAVDEMLTGSENLRLMADLHHLPRRSAQDRITELLQRFELADDADTVAGAYSGGMRRKLDLAMTLVNRPRVIFLDEPTTGLDPRSRRTMWSIIRDLVADDGVTIFLTTQYLEEADQLADRIAVLDGGRFVAQGSPAELKRLVPGSHVRFGFASPTALAESAALFPGSTPDEASMSLRVPGDGELSSLRELLDRLDRASLAPTSMSIHTPDLDDVFLTLTGRRALEDGTDPNTESTAGAAQAAAGKETAR